MLKNNNAINRIHNIGYLKYKSIRINNFSSSIILSNPGVNTEPEQEEVSKWSISTPETPDVDPSKAIGPTFESDKLNVYDNIHKELQEKNFPRDVKVVDEMVAGHLKERDIHIAAYDEEIRQDKKQEILVLRKDRNDEKITDSELFRYIRKANQQLTEERRQHSQACEKENQEVKMQISHYIAQHCVKTPETESPPKEQSTIDYVLEKQATEMPDIYDSDGGD